ncbi:YIP1 family protein [Methanospirillum sp. J.3.6.1-F.2.7.3]|uniref:YIP1 family protein n=1 Tax=Methanospirillum purgamenti TaxID=2834276 RepID=A0A8E7EFN0_9EURY|nr:MULTISPECIES: YIP1 family protein [Methanospirillum]MDX8550067.1 YIP1 family protein [Methanospirillum hungatei]QVV87433.1 YIP1 family protein [Methanospirillum sp. J.3.6.1-F.2.7.3]
MSFDEGLRLFKSANYKASSEQFAAITKTDENNHKAWNALGICLSKLGQFDDAFSCFEKALKLDPGNERYEKNLQIIKQKIKPIKNASTKNPPINIEKNNYTESKFKSYFEFIKEFLLNPHESFKKVQDNEVLRCIKQIIPLYAFFGILSWFFNNSSNNGLLSIYAIAVVFGGIIGVFLDTIFLHIGIKIFGGGNNNGWIKTYYIVIYGFIPYLLVGWIPIVGQILGGILSFYLLVVGLKQLHNLSTKQAILSIIGTAIILVIFFVIIATLFFNMTENVIPPVPQSSPQIISSTVNPTIITTSSSVPTIQGITQIPTIDVTSLPTSIPTVIPTVKVVIPFQTSIPKAVIKSSPSSLTYEEMARYPDNYKGQPVTIEGEVHGATYTPEGWGFSMDTKKQRYNGDVEYFGNEVYVWFTKNYDGARLLDNDIVRVSGTFDGMHTFEYAHFKGTEELPYIMGDSLDIRKFA